MGAWRPTTDPGKNWREFSICLLSTTCWMLLSGKICLKNQATAVEVSSLC